MRLAACGLSGAAPARNLLAAPLAVFALALVDAAVPRAARADGAPPQSASLQPQAASPAPQAPPLGLRELQAIARKVDPRALIAYAQLEAAQGKKSEADWIWFPAFETTLAAGGPVPEARLNSPCTTPDNCNIFDITDGTRKGLLGGLWGVQLRAEMSARLPIYTFGKISSGQAAAAHGVEARAQLLARDRNLVAFDVARAYWSYQTTRDARKSIDDVQAKIGEARKTAARLLAEESDQVTSSDAARLELIAEEVGAQNAAALAGQRVAEVALKLLVGRMPDDALEVRREELPLPPEPPPASLLLERARGVRPELKAAAENVAARKALVDLERAKYLPDLALVGGASWAWTSNASSPNSPFVSNPYNFYGGYLALALRGTFDFPVKQARVTQLEADLHEAEALQAGAEKLLRLELERALGDLAAARGRAGHYQKASATAKKLVVKGAVAFDSGLGAASDLLIDLLLFSRSEGERLRACLDGQTAWAALENAVGGDIESPARASNPADPAKGP